MLDHRIPDPFHEGELRAQTLAGGGPAGAPIRRRMPEQHRAFFPLLPFICVAVAEDDGWPLATLLHGAPGFVSAPDPGRLRIGALPDAGDPARAHLLRGGAVGLLGIDLATRRRNRANGMLAQVDDTGLLIEVRESFGNCPKYIHVRRLEPATRRRSACEAFDAVLPADAASMIAACDTLFVATSGGAAAGLDMSHRGGEAGFLRLQGNVLTVPDYAGNRYFNTLGNLLLEPRAALLIVDIASGDILQLQGVANVTWQASPANDPREERSWTFMIRRGWLRRAAFPLQEAQAPA